MSTFRDDDPIFHSGKNIARLRFIVKEFEQREGGVIDYFKFDDLTHLCAVCLKRVFRVLSGQAHFGFPGRTPFDKGACKFEGDFFRVLP